MVLGRKEMKKRQKKIKINRGKDQEKGMERGRMEDK